VKKAHPPLGGEDQESVKSSPMNAVSGLAERFTSDGALVEASMKAVLADSKKKSGTGWPYVVP
jgi:hypothetical protein